MSHHPNHHRHDPRVTPFHIELLQQKVEIHADLTPAPLTDRQRLKLRRKHAGEEQAGFVWPEEIGGEAGSGS